MRSFLASNLESRDGTLAKDAGGKNALTETDGDSSVMLLRPGALPLGTVGAGVGQLLACYNNQLKSIVGNTLADLTIAGSAVSVAASQPITSIEPDLPFFSQVSGQAQTQNLIVLKNAKEAWVYKP